jgi:hypothetical protein
MSHSVSWYKFTKYSEECTAAIFRLQANFRLISLYEKEGMLLSKRNAIYILYKRHVGTFFLLWSCGPMRTMAYSFLMFLDHTKWNPTLIMIPLEEWSTRRRDLYLTTLTTQPSIPLAGFEPTISARERPQTHALDRAATGTGWTSIYYKLIAQTLAVIQFYNYVTLLHVSTVLIQL